MAAQFKHPFFSLSFLFFSVVFCVFLCGISQAADPAPMMEISLFTGIPGVARIGESFTEVNQRKVHPHERLDFKDDPEIVKLKITDALVFPTLGTKIYFRRTGAVLIVSQEPFKGSIKNKKIRLFSFSVPAVSDWGELLLRELGQPQARASGGRFGSEGLFYSWGDLSYNRMGPNQLALYRDLEVGKYRLNNFGREVQMFPGQK